MKLTSNKIIDILKEEYDKRIQSCLNEFEELVDDKGNDRFEDGQGLKVYGPDRTEFTLGGKKEIKGVSYRILYREYEPRVKKSKSLSKLSEDDLYDERQDIERLQNVDSAKMTSDKSLQGRDYILVSDEDFKKYFRN